MKKFRKLIPALCMLLVSALFVGTSTYAWFSMNTTVTATNMQVKAKSDNTYLLIGKQNNLDTIKTDGKTSEEFTVSDADAKVFPSAPVLSDTEVGYTAADKTNVKGEDVTVAGVKVTDATTAAAVTNWYTASALKPGAATIDGSTAAQLKEFGSYVIVKNFYLTLSTGSNKANNLTVTPTFAQKDSGTDLAACKAVITTSDGGFAILDNSKNGAAVDIKGSNTGLTDSTVVTVTAYIYVDGNDAQVYTNNMANLKGASIEFKFGVTSTPAA